MIKPIYLMYGENEYAINSEIIKISKKFNYIIKNIEKEIKLDELLNIVNTDSLFEKKIIYIYKYDSILLEKNFKELIDKYLQNHSIFSILIFQFNKKIKLKKLLPDSFYKKNLIYEFNLIKNKDVGKWIKVCFENKGYKIDEKAIIFLIEELGCDQNIILNEINKIFIYLFKNNNKIIKIKNIKEILSSNTKSNIFQLIDELIEKKIEKMIKSYNFLIKSNESEIKIIFMLIREFRFLLLSKYYILQNKDSNFLSNIFNIHPFFANKLYKKAFKIDIYKIKKYLIKFYKIEEKIKIGEKNIKNLLLTILINYIIEE